jgi:cytochrome oxidase Cu insertion factor (SCO1/SenC/PrrC family)
VPGMNSGLSPADPTLVAAFRSALLHQGGIALLIIALLWLIWGTARAWRLTTPAAPKPGAGGAAATGGGAAATAPGGGWLAGKRSASMAGWARRANAPAEPRGRWLLRIGFGTIWILDGILQAQPKMAAGLPSQVIEPTAAASPRWVQELVNWGGTIWSYHPIQAGAASVWIQVGIGAWLIVAARGPWSRLAGLASVAWGLIVWAFGESFGGIFAPGLSWLTGAPGGVLIYVVAGALIALPEGAWRSPRLGRLLLGGIGLFFLGMAVLQAWPGRGYWKGTIGGQPGTLTAMVQSMATTPQPHFLSALLADFGSFAASNGFVVNLVVVIVLAAIGGVFLTGKPALVRYAVWFGIAFCLATWLLVQDLGFLGGLGTDPNSMIPLILLFSAGYLSLTPAPEEVTVSAVVGEVGLASVTDEVMADSGTPEVIEVGGGTPGDGTLDGGTSRSATLDGGTSGTSGGGKADGGTSGSGTSGTSGGGIPDGGTSGSRTSGDGVLDGGTSESGTSGTSGGGTPGGGGRGRLGVLTPKALGGRLATASASSVAALAALAVVVLGAAPMASATVNRTADPILALAIEGASEQMDTPAYNFQLTDQNGQPVTLATLRGKVVLMTFLDPVCTTDCPIIAQEFREAGVLLGPADKDVVLVAIVANPIYRSTEFTQAFDRQEGLNTVRNWLYLTGSVSELGRVWNQYGVAVQDLPAGAMVAHEDLAVIIDRSGNIRWEVGADPGPATTSTQSSYSVLLTQYARQALADS